MKTVYLIPTTLSDSPLNSVLPEYVLKDIIPNLTVFMVENLRTARRFLKKVDKQINIDSLQFCEIGKNADKNTIITFFQKYSTTHDIGILSEAGCPGIADPGADIVAMAHRKGVSVVPLVGASSLLMALMSSGFNGQSFTFNGYLPVQKEERAKMLKSLESKVQRHNQSQLFIETPFRNQQLFEAILTHCNERTNLCIACNITAEDEYIRTLSIRKWKEQTIHLHKRPTVFILG